MDLWIRSQNKEDLVKCHNLGLAYLGKYGFIDKIGDVKRDLYYICEFTDECHTSLASYKTKERALEVLDEIQSILNLFDRFIKEPKDMFKNFFIPPCYVYPMPKE